MSALEKQHNIEVRGPAPVASSAKGSVGDAVDDSLFRISAGPAALAQLLIYRMLSMYLNIIDLDAEQKINMTHAQVKEAEAQANATIQAGKALGEAMIVGAAISIGFTAFSFASNFFVSRGSYESTKDQMNDIEGKIVPLKKIDELMPKIGEPEEGMSTAPTKEEVDTRITELRNKDYESKSLNEEYDEKLQKAREEKKPDVVKQLLKDKEDKWNATTKGALEQMSKSNDEEEVVNLDDVSMEEKKKAEIMTLKEFKQQYQEDLNFYSRQLNTKALKLMEISNMRQMVGQSIKGVGDSGSQVAQAVGNKAKAQHDAEATLNQVAANISANQTQEFGAAMGKAFDAAIQALRTLQEIHRTNSVQG